MKKVWLIVLSVLAVTLCAAFGLSGCGDKPEEEELISSFAVLTDVHIMDESYYDTPTEYAVYSSVDKLEHLSVANLNTIADKIIAEDKLEYVLVAGDLADDGDEASMLTAARILKRIEDSGKDVYVINGNHDGREESLEQDRVPCARFKEIFADFGYSEAIDKDDNSDSYVVERGDVRIIALDSVKHYEEDGFVPYMDEDRLNWLQNALDDCNEDEDTPIVMTHQSFVSHFPGIIGLVADKNDGDYKTKALEIMAKAGVQLLFTGHNHGNAIETYTDEVGNVVYDIETCSTVAGKCSYRIVDVKEEGYQINTYDLLAVDEKYLPALISAEEKAKVTTDLQSYSSQHFGAGIAGKVRTYTDAEYLVGLLGAEGALADTIRLAINKVGKPLLEVSIYAKDAEVGQESLESAFAPYDITIPPSDYTHIMDVVVHYALEMFKGNEHITADSAEYAILKYAITYLFGLFGGKDFTDGIAELYPNLPKLNIDRDKLLGEGLFDLINSKLVEVGIGVASSIDGFPSALSNLHLDNTGLIKRAAALFLSGGFTDIETAVPKLLFGTDVPPLDEEYEQLFVGTTDVDLYTLFDNVLVPIALDGLFEDIAPNDLTLFIPRAED